LRPKRFANSAFRLWLLKLVTLEFFDRLVGLSGKNRYTMLLHFMRGTLAVTFIAVVISNLAECQPFAHYWQVSPDPGPQCRQAYAHLITTTVCNVLTDLLLVVFPVPIVVKSRIPLGRKTLLVMLFCLHLFTVVIAIYRVPEILKSGGYQTTRTMWASGEVFMATFAANALTIGTFVRDTGVKKQKFKYQPTESATKSVRREPRVAKTVGWDDPDFDVEETAVSPRASSRVDMRHMGDGGDLKKESSIGKGERAVRRSDSRDSLIPRSRFAASSSLDSSARVVKTTTIEVTVSAAESPGRADHGGGTNRVPVVIRPADNVTTASARGRGRGSSIVLQNLKPLPNPDAGQGGQRREM
jgi:hypothetical protein